MREKTVHRRRAMRSALGRRIRAAAHLVRDAVVTLFSAMLIATTQGSEEMAATLLQGLGAVFIALSIVDVILVAAKRRARGFFVGNAVYQIIASFLIAGLFPPAGVPMLALNVVALVSLREKKTAEELALHPPLPRTRNYKLLVGAGVAVLVVSALLPWISTADATYSLVMVYSGIVGRSGLPGLAISPIGVVFAMFTLFLSPLSPLLGALSIRWRRCSLTGGVFGVLGGAGLVVAAQPVASVGAYAFAAGGVVLVAASLAFRKRQ